MRSLDGASVAQSQPRSERTPYHFRPMAELTHEEPVEMALAVSGRVVTGRLIRGIVAPCSRTFVQWESGTWVVCTPIGWREFVTIDVLAEWKQREQGKVAA